MTDIQPTASTPDQDAAEYALGVTTADQRREAERRMASDPAFAGLVSAWDERLAPLIDAIPAKTPPRVVWMRIAAQLGLAPAKPGVWSNVNVWRTATGVFAVAAAASMAILLVYPKPVETPTVVQSTPEATLTSVGLLKGETGPASFVVTLDRANKRLVIAPVSSDGLSDKSFEMATGSRTCRSSARMAIPIRAWYALNEPFPDPGPTAYRAGSLHLPHAFQPGRSA
jgi:anti-sigma-K factor RskA